MLLLINISVMITLSAVMRIAVEYIIAFVIVYPVNQSLHNF